uniref:Hemagglutinin n=1 Tax=Influenza A virus (A/duck/Hokkaido/95/1981(H8N4)) TaxID=551236 RepID=B3Y958_9INFA|nr:haemagglutinin [Influenza A virus (A/duck/Hokkaido/95/1981(H8N4))]
MEKFIIITMLLVSTNAYDRICIGYQSNNSTDTVNTLIEQNVPVTQTMELVETEKHPAYCNTDLGAPLELRDCKIEAVIYGNPKCDIHLKDQGWSYIVERPSAPEGMCYPGSVENLEELRFVFSSAASYKRIRLFDYSRWNVTSSGTSKACNASTGGQSFYRSINWLTKKKPDTYDFNEGTYINNEDGDIIFLWGIHHPPDAKEQTTLYKNANTLSSVTTNTINRSFQPNIGPRPLVRGQQGWMDYYWGILKRGETLKIRTNGNLIAPEFGYLLKGESHGRIIQNEDIPIGSCHTKCQTYAGAINSSKPFQNASRHHMGECPKYVKKESLRLAVGLRNTPSVEPKGLFGAIAGFIEGGWSGMIDGWYGFHHSNSEGTGMAADQKSTQEAIGKITNKVNNIVDKMNREFEVVNHEFSGVEKRINMINDKIDDQIEDLWAYNAELLVLLENQKTLDEHDSNVENLFDEVRRRLSVNAIDAGNGCFDILHKCDNECMETIKNGTYNHKDYEEEAKLERSKINGVILEENTTYKILSIYSTVAASLCLAILIAGGLILGMQNGSCRCMFCI